MRRTLDRRVYRRSSFTRSEGIALIVGGTGLMGTLAAAALHGHAVGLAAISIGTAVVCVVVGIAQLGSKLEVDAGRVRVVNLMTVHAFDRNEVESFAIARYRMFPKACVMHLHGGSRIGIWALPGFSSAWRESDPWLERIVDELNALL